MYRNTPCTGILNVQEYTPCTGIYSMYRNTSCTGLPTSSISKRFGCFFFKLIYFSRFSKLKILKFAFIKPYNIYFLKNLKLSENDHYMHLRFWQEYLGKKRPNNEPLKNVNVKTT